MTKSKCLLLARHDIYVMLVYESSNAKETSTECEKIRLNSQQSAALNTQIHR